MDRIALVLVMTLILCSGCSTPGSTTSATQVPPPASDQSGLSTPPPPEKSPTGTASGVTAVLDVQARDVPDGIMIQLTGNGPFGGYAFQMMGAKQFALDIDGIQKAPLQDTIANLSNGLKDLRVVENQPGQIRLLGTLSAPLRDYSVQTPGNALVLNLYPPSRPGKAGQKFSQPRPAMSEAGAVRRDSVAASVQPRPAGNVMGSSEFAGQKKTYNGKIISLDLQDADLKNVLRLLADVSGMNIVIEPDVAGRVTLKVERVPWDQVLDMVLAMNGLGKEQASNIIRIARQDKLRQELKIQEDQIKAQQELAEATRNVGQPSTVYFTINYARPGDIAAKINDIKSEKGKISVDEPTSLVIYSDYPYFLETAKQLIAKLDKPKPQVMIEARIIMLGSSSSKELGIDWGFRTSRPSNPPEKYNFDQSFQVNVPPIPSSYGLNWAQMIGKTMLDINLTLSALEQLGKSKTLSAPRVLTLDGIEAVISQGVDVPYLTLSDAGTASTSFRKAVLELKVKPHITPDGRVKLGIQAKNEKPDFSRVVNGQPPIATQEINTELFVDDGNTVVIGGIIVDREDVSTGGTPGLMKVPVLGQFFRTDNTIKEKSELLIFISPRIIGVTTPEPGNHT